MFARILEFVPKMEKKDELISVVKKEILPILKKQPGFVDILPFVPEETIDRILVVSLWTEKRHIEHYMKETFPNVERILKPYLTTPITWKLHRVETTLCEHFIQAMAA
ncbi:MAG TPA: antibiotic biosynthesis monooxygenase [Terriglobales bacterium]|nr:antibiotic biosynthesis monooxygenase [Terriglobales bacterium]